MATLELTIGDDLAVTPVQRTRRPGALFWIAVLLDGVAAGEGGAAAPPPKATPAPDDQKGDEKGDDKDDKKGADE